MQPQVSLTHWPDELLDYLRQITREYKFNWSSIAKEMETYVQNHPHQYSNIEISSTICRQRFALDYKVVNANPEVVIKDDTPMQSMAPSQSTLNINSIDTIKTYESMSLEDLIAHVDSTEMKMKQQKEDIFKRILTSLSITPTQNKEEEIEEEEKDKLHQKTPLLNDHDEVRKAFEESILVKELDKQKKLDHQYALHEKNRLDMEREILRKRFDKDSIDNEGIDPLVANSLPIDEDDTDNILKGDEKVKHSNFIITEQQDDDTTTATLHSNSVITIGSSSLSIPYLESDEFEHILSQLEQEISEKAVAKDDEEEVPSELSEILSVLEAAAALKKTTGIGLSTTAAATFSELVPTSSLGSSSDKALTLKAPIKIVEAISETSRSLSSDTSNVNKINSSTTILKSSEYAASSNKNQPRTHIKESLDVKSAIVSSSGGISYGRSTMRSSKEQQQQHIDSEKAKQSSLEPSSENDDSAEDADSDDDWKSMRNKQKQQTDIGAAIMLNPIENTGFWGAFGTTTQTKSRNTRGIQNESSAVLEISIASRIATEALEQNRIIDDDDDDEYDDHLLASSPTIAGYEKIELRPEINPEKDIVKGVSGLIENGRFIETLLASEEEANDPHTFFLPNPSINEIVVPVVLTTEILDDHSINSLNEVLEHCVKEDQPLMAPLIDLQELSGSLAGTTGTTRRSKTSKLASIMSSNKPVKKPSSALLEQVQVDFNHELNLPEQESLNNSMIVSNETAPIISTLMVEQVESIINPIDSQVISTETVESVISHEIDTGCENNLVDEEILSSLHLGELSEAPVLSCFPFKTVTNKSSGESITFHGSTLPAYGTDEISAQSIYRLIIANIDITADSLYGNYDHGAGRGGRSDLPWIRLLSWLLQISSENYSLIAMQLMDLPKSSSMVSVETKQQQVVLRLVLESKSEHISSNDLIETVKCTCLHSIAFPQRDAILSETLNGLKISDVINIKDFLTPAFAVELQSFNNSPSSYMQNLTPIALVTNKNLKANLPFIHNINNVAACILKDYTIDLLKSDFFEAFIMRAEESGLRLCGLRIVYLDTMKIFEIEKFSSIPVHTRSTCNSKLFKNNARIDSQHLLATVCLAFHAIGHYSPSPTSISSITSSILRSILGPDDPELAIKTDPESLRAKYGTSKELNLAYPIAYSLSRITKEVSFWFGNRNIKNEQATAQPVTSMLFAAKVFAFKVGISFSSIRENLNSSSAILYHDLQKAMLSFIDSNFGSSCISLSITSVSSLSAYKKLMGNQVKTHSDPPIVNVTVEDHNCATQYFVWSFLSCVSELFITKTLSVMYDHINRYTTNRSHYSSYDCSLSIEWALDQPLTESNLSENKENSDSEQNVKSKGENTLDASVFSGSRLIALEMLKTISENDCKSHEDIGLSDVILIQLSLQPTHIQPSPLKEQEKTKTKTLPVHVSIFTSRYLLELFKLLPVTCLATIVAIKSSTDDKSIFIAIRGYQIIENIDVAIAQLHCDNSSSSGTAHHKSSINRSIGSIAADNNDSAIVSRTLSSMTSTMFPNIQAKVYRGRKSIEILFIEFPLDALFIDLAIRDLNTYVPFANIVRKSTEINPNVTTTNTTNRAFQCAQALYPPGVFTAVATLIIPWLKDNNHGTMTRNLGRIVTRLEKEGFELLEIKATKNIDISLLVHLYNENIAEYLIPSIEVSSNLESFESPSKLEHMKVENKYNHIFDTTLDAVVILVRRRSALLKLKSIIGPVFSAELAETYYPRSIISLLNSLATSSSSSLNNSTTNRNIKSIVKQEIPPYVLPTLTCISAQRALEYLFPALNNSYELQQYMMSITGSSSSIEEQTDKYTTSLNKDILPIANRWNKLISAIQNGITLPQGDTIKLKSTVAESTVTAAAVVGHKNMDIAGIVICNELLKQEGLGAILEALHREELTVRNIYSSYLPNIIVKQLHQLAGASSLSMKPPIQLMMYGSETITAGDHPIQLLQGPAVILGVEGPSHAFVRFKSFALSPRSSTQLLWKISTSDSRMPSSNISYNSMNSTPNSNISLTIVNQLPCIPAIESSQWGVLASSSSRLAKDLYRFCFDDIYGEDDSNFTIINTTQT